jgi:hypothetical protein
MFERRRGAVRVLFVAATLVSTGCPTPGQSGGLAEVDVAGFAGRMRVLCRSGIGAPAGEGACLGSGGQGGRDGGAADVRADGADAADAAAADGTDAAARD